MCALELQRSLGRNILELLMYYLMPNKCKHLKDMKSFCLSSVLVAFKITKVDISCIITCDSDPYCSNFITCIRIYFPCYRVVARYMESGIKGL